MRPGSNQPYSPRDAGEGGYYEISAKTGLLVAGLAADAPIFSFMWTPINSSGVPIRAQLKFLRAKAIVQTAFGTPQLIDFYASKVRGFTVADSGGTPVKPATLDNKRQSIYQDTLANDIRIATTGALTAGTRTIEALPFWGIQVWAGAIGALGERESTFDEHHVPLVLTTGEGIIIKNGTLFGASGVVQVFIEMGWMEESIGLHAW
jgi:hypothetical protein